MVVDEMKKNRWMCDKIRKNRIINEKIGNKLGNTSIVNKIWKYRMRRIKHVQRKLKNVLIRRIDNFKIENLVKRKSKLLKIWIQIIRKEIIVKNLVEKITFDSNEWLMRIRTN